MANSLTLKTYTVLATRRTKDGGMPLFCSNRIFKAAVALVMAFSTGAACAQTQGAAASLMQRVVTSNMEQCMQLLTQAPRLDPYAPKAPAARVTYCNCVAGTYSASLPDNQLIALSGGKIQDKPGEPQARARAAAVRLDAARSQCAKSGAAK
jgi:hypothetical protein